MKKSEDLIGIVTPEQVMVVSDLVPYILGSRRSIEAKRLLKDLRREQVFRMLSSFFAENTAGLQV